MSAIEAGTRFGKLLVLGQGPLARNRLTRWRVLCDCGGLRMVTDRSLRLHTVRSCGCLRKESMVIVRAGGKPAVRAYKAFYSLQQKVENVKSVLYPAVGGSGVKIHPAWVRNFPAFWLDMGAPPEGYWLMRKDTRGDYSPLNCVWAPKSQVAANTRSKFAPRLEHAGQSMTAHFWAMLLGLSEADLSARIASGQTLSEIVNDVAMPMTT